MSMDAVSASGSAVASRAGGLQAQPRRSAPAQGGTPGASSVPNDSVELSPQASAQLAKLKARDTQVRAHEQAHMSAGGGLITGGPTYTYQEGPDGKRYAIGGEVSIDSSPVQGNPQATIAKAHQIQAAALAPADPSGQDESVASQAEAMAAQAEIELAKANAKSSASPGAGRSDTPGARVDVSG